VEEGPLAAITAAKKGNTEQVILSTSFQYE